MPKNQKPSRTVLPLSQPTSFSPMPLDVRTAPKPEPIQPLRPPQGAPHIVIVLIDDMGFGASSAFGGPCFMPTVERLATRGLTYTRFHTTALCSPTRAALLTGRNHHSVNMASICETASSYPGYTSVRPDSAATIAQTLRMNGYNTAAFGKMHQTPVWETSQSGPFDRWPTGDGFEKFYGFLGGDCNQWTPPLIDGTTPIDPPRTPEEGYHLSEDITEKAISYVHQQHMLTPDKPFFVYLAFGATHAPHHVPQEWRDRYRGKFDHGWDRQRELTIARQKELGIVPQACDLTARHQEIPAWESLTDEDKLVSTRLMETYAAFAEHTDYQVGRLMDALTDMDVADNTLFFYILGDNGASSEAGPYGSFNEMALQNQIQVTTQQILPHLDEIGGPLAFNHYPAGWAHAMNAPYQWTKIIASHWGGTRNGMVVHWPQHIKTRGLRHQWCHCIDVVPTILEAVHLPHPTSVNGVAQQPIEGISFLPTFQQANAPEKHQTQYFELGGNRAIYQDGWSACTKHSMPWTVPDEHLPAFTDDVWELYAPDDWSQAHNVAATYPEKLHELQQVFLSEAAKYHVLPLDDRKYERLNADIAGRPDLLQGRTSMTFTPGMGRLSENTVPNIKNKSFTITADITVPTGSADGVIIAQGGRFAGWSLYLKSGVLTYCHNYVDLEHYFVRSSAPLSPGNHTIRLSFAYDGGGIGKGGTAVLFVDEHQVGQGRIEKTVPNLFAFDETLDIGRDNGSPVTEDYTTPRGTFTGTINWVKIDIGSETYQDASAIHHAMFIRQ